LTGHTLLSVPGEGVNDLITCQRAVSRWHFFVDLQRFEWLRKQRVQRLKLRLLTPLAQLRAEVASPVFVAWLSPVSGLTSL
jgi:hypothetical protein